jgi:hypothetical protein
MGSGFVAPLFLSFSVGGSIWDSCLVAETGLASAFSLSNRSQHLRFRYDKPSAMAVLVAGCFILGGSTLELGGRIKSTPRLPITGDLPALPVEKFTAVP